MTVLEDYKKKLRIDEHALEIALRDHPDLVFDIGQELALAISNRDEAKQELDELRAEVANELRAEASRNDERITDSAVNSGVELDKRVKSANDAFLARKLEASQWQVLKEACEQRSYALSKLVDLYLANYYSNIEKRGADARDSDMKNARAQAVKDHRKRVTV